MSDIQQLREELLHVYSQRDALACEVEALKAERDKFFERRRVCVLCGEPWVGGANRCQCGGFCTWGEVKGGKPDSWRDYDHGVPEMPYESMLTYEQQKERAVQRAEQLERQLAELTKQNEILYEANIKYDNRLAEAQQRIVRLLNTLKPFIRQERRLERADRFESVISAEEYNAAVKEYHNGDA